ncbi:MAG: ribonuclease inhibitor [Anaerofustis stercorihominis]|nr:ribonuclease inhibitor [Anaerofustis stercorihominis]
MKLRIIDCKKFTDKNSAHEEIMQAMEFPGYYGKNLDALWDMLTEITDDTLILLVNSSYAAEDTENIIHLFREAEEENPRLRIAFTM